MTLLCKMILPYLPKSRPLVKTLDKKNLISKPKYMLLVLKKTVSIGPMGKTDG